MLEIGSAQSSRLIFMSYLARHIVGNRRTFERIGSALKTAFGKWMRITQQEM